MSPEEEVSRGLEAERLLREPLLVEAFEKLQEEYTRAWQTSPVRDADAREKLYLTLLMLDKLKGDLRIVMESGQLAQRQSLMERARKTGKQLFGG